MESGSHPTGKRDLKSDNYLSWNRDVLRCCDIRDAAPQGSRRDNLGVYLKKVELAWNGLETE